MRKIDDLVKRLGMTSTTTTVGARVDGASGAAHAPKPPPAALTDAEVEELVGKIRAGDEAAWQALWLQVERVVKAAAGSFRALSRLSRDKDALGDVVANVMGELRRDDFRRLADLDERLARRDGSWRWWLRTVARNEARTYVRDHEGYLGHVEGGGSRWARKVEFSDERGEGRHPAFRCVEAHLILAWAHDELTRPQLGALLLWLQDASPAEIAEEMELRGGAAEAKRLVHSAVERLRYKFAEGHACPRDSSPRRRAGPK